MWCYSYFPVYLQKGMWSTQLWSPSNVFPSRWWVNILVNHGLVPFLDLSNSKNSYFFLTNEDFSSPCYLCRDTKIKSLDLRHLLHCWTYQHMGHLFAENRAVFAAGLVCIPTCVLQHFGCTQKRGILWILWFLGGSMVCLTLLEMYQVQFSYGGIDFSCMRSGWSAKTQRDFQSSKLGHWMS